MEYKKYKERLTDYPEVLSGVNVFKYQHDLIATKLNTYNFFTEEDLTDEIRADIVKSESKLKELDDTIELLEKKVGDN